MLVFKVDAYMVMLEITIRLLDFSNWAVSCNTPYHNSNFWRSSNQYFQTKDILKRNKPLSWKSLLQYNMCLAASRWRATEPYSSTCTKHPPSHSTKKSPGNRLPECPSPTNKSSTNKPSFDERPKKQPAATAALAALQWRLENPTWKKNPHRKAHKLTKQQPGPPPGNCKGNDSQAKPHNKTKRNSKNAPQTRHPCPQKQQSRCPYWHTDEPRERMNIIHANAWKRDLGR